MTRQDYTESRSAFLASNSKPVAEPVLAGDKSVVGWTISRDGEALPSARNGVRVFKTLGAIATLCQDNKIGSFEVAGL
jgi:hypothetical protein